MDKTDLLISRSALTAETSDSCTKLLESGTGLTKNLGELPIGLKKSEIDPADVLYTFLDKLSARLNNLDKRLYDMDKSMLSMHSPSSEKNISLKVEYTVNAHTEAVNVLSPTLPADSSVDCVTSVGGFIYIYILFYFRKESNIKGVFCFSLR